MQQRLSSVLGRRPQRRDGDKESITLAEWSPLVDITEDDKEYLIKAELPEIKKEEIKVTVEISSSLSEHEHITQIQSRKSSGQCPPLGQQTAATTAADRTEDSGNGFYPGVPPPDRQPQSERSTKCRRRGKREALPSKTNGYGSHRGFPCC
jgi:hypothetical protein